MSLVIPKTFLWNETVWNPGMLQTALWLDASDSTTLFTTDTGTTLATNGSAVGRWADKSNNKNNFVQATAGNRPILTTSGINSKNSIDLLSNGSISGLRPFPGTGSVIYVQRNIQDDKDYLLIAEVGSSSRYLLYAKEGGSGTTINSNSGTPSIYVDGALQSFSNNGSVYTALSTTAKIIVLENCSLANWTALTMQIGGYGAPFSPSNVLVSEVICISGSLSTLDRQKTEGYLSAKWNIALPSGHPYKDYGPKP